MSSEFNFPTNAFGYVPGTIPAKIIYADTAPTNPVEALFWMNTAPGELQGTLSIRASIVDDIPTWVPLNSEGLLRTQLELLDSTVPIAGVPANEVAQFGFFGDGIVLRRKNHIVIAADGQAWFWKGALPKTVVANTTPENSGGIGIDKWQKVITAFDSGNFQTGFTATTANQFFLWPTAIGGDGDRYVWQGSFPKIVPANSSPASTGGIGYGAWQILNPKATVNVPNLKALASIPMSERREGTIYRVMEFDGGTGIGGHDVKWLPLQAWTSDQVGAYWPDSALNGYTSGNKATLYGSYGSGIGCWGRTSDPKAKTAESYGVVDYSNGDSTIPLNAYLSERGLLTFNVDNILLKKYAPGTIGGIPIRQAATLDGNGATVTLDSTTAFFYVGREQDYYDATFVRFYGITAGVDYAQIIADCTIDAVTFTVNAGEENAFDIGDLVYVRLGQSVYDSAEPDYFYYAKVKAKASGSVTLDRPSGYAMSVAATTNIRQRRIIKMTGVTESLEIKNLYLDGRTDGADVEAGIQIRYGRNINISNVGGVDVGAGLIFAQFAENLKLQNVYVNGSANDEAQASKGRAFNFAECKDVSVEQFRIEGCRRSMIVIEGGCERVNLDGGVIVNNFPSRPNDRPIISLLGSEDCHLRNVKIEGNPCTVVASITNLEQILPILIDIEMSDSFAPSWDAIPKYFQVRDVEANVKMGSVFRFQEKRNFTLEIEMNTLTTLTKIPLPNGVYTKITVTCTDKTRLTQLFFARDDLVNQVPTTATLLPSTMSSGVPFELPYENNAYPYFIVGSNHVFSNPAFRRNVFYRTSGGVSAGEKIYVNLEFFPAPITPSSILVDSVGYLAV